MIQIYNTMSRKKEKFKPLEPGKVKMYVCGPTVYNYIHIGNARSTVAFDTIRKYLEYRGYQVDYVSNFTDVDDKIIRTAAEEAVLPRQLADRFIAAFTEDTTALNVAPANNHPRVMDHIPDIIAFIEELITQGFAYQSQGDIYYRTRQFENYGKLSDQTLDELEVGASQRTGSEQTKKEDPLDFALWKEVPVEEWHWQSPWGIGRPGWHIECSVMATKHLGETIDIHAGGQDLQFPHHENEIAQSEAKTGQTFANYWMHNGYVTVGGDNEKMSKSLGNFVTVHDLLKEVDGQVLRFALATAHYRRPLPFRESTLSEAKQNLQRIQNSFDNTNFQLKNSQKKLKEDQEDLRELKELENAFVQAMDDDFNTANGITIVYDLVKWLNLYNERRVVSETLLIEGTRLLTEWTAIFGIQLQTTSALNDQRIEALVEERKVAREKRDFTRSDEIRDQLEEQGIIVEDTAQGMRWRRQS